MAKTRVLLDYDDFAKLVKGEIVKQGDVEIALSDIGFDNMIELIMIQIKE